MANYALFDTETVIDWQLVEDVEDVGRDEFLFMLQDEQKRERPEDVFIPLSYHVPAVIAIGLLDANGTLKHLGCVRGANGEERTREFWDWLGRFQSKPANGTLVSFNGRGFDIPVLELAAMRYGIRLPESHFHEKFGNRYRYQSDWHLDVMDYLTDYGAIRPHRGGLALLSVLAGMPRRMVFHSNLDGARVEQMERWCRNDVRRLYVVFERLQYIRGHSQTLPQLPELEDET